MQSKKHSIVQVPTLNRVQKRSRIETAEAQTPGLDCNQRAARDNEFERWLAKYEPVERAIIEERARRFASAQNRRSKCRLERGTEMEATEGLATVIRGKGRFRRVEDSQLTASQKGWAGDDVPLARIGSTSLYVFDGGIVSVLLSLVGAKCTRELDAMRHRLKRPMYYERENARRRALAAERRKVTKRTTEKPCPTREDILDAWIKVKISREAMLRFGGMMEDLECYVDNSLRFNECGDVVGRAPGIKGWLQMNIPALYLKYKTIMRYKAAAKKLRQIVELKDPSPVSLILSPHMTATAVETAKKVQAEGESIEYEILMRTKSKDAVERVKGQSEWARVEVLRARAVYLEAMDGVPDNATRTIARLDELLDPERVEDATMLKTWKARYENEITLRTKSRWMKRLFKRTG